MQLTKERLFYKRMKKDNKQLYESFHKHSTQQKKIISENDYTYFFISKILKAIIGQRKQLQVLDFGCGVATIATYVASMGNTVYGIDISEKSIQIANENARTSAVADRCLFAISASPAAFDAQQKTFDLILCFEVIEHVPDDVQIVKSLAQRLSTTGFLVVSTRSSNSLLYKLGFLKRFDVRVGHRRRYTDESLRNVLETAGLTVRKQYKVDSILRDLLYSFPFFGFFIRGIRGPLVRLVAALENPLLSVFGNAGYIVVATKHDQNFD